ncbi:RNA polymerase sigma factor [Promicromonospora sp. NPDC057488]|uniref:RNA polymerase sigma factor n=1 Tax=Promicromonospora sp. NPDC057488 TaxID=3346147 RepID=UPI003670CA7A
MTASDEALLAGMAADDQDAAAVFVRRHQARVYGLALFVVGIPAVAEEVAQETFVRAWRHADGFDPRRGRATTWLLAIARHAAIDVLRVRRDVPVDPVVMAEVLAERVTARTVGDPDRLANQVATGTTVDAALAQVPREQATAVVLASVFGLSGAEIAERTGVPLGTAKTRIRLGLRHLRDELASSREVDRP